MKNYFYILFRNTLAGLNSPVLKIINNKIPMASFLLFRQIIVLISSLFMVDIKDVKREYQQLNKKDKVFLYSSSIILALSIYLIFIALNYVPITLFSLIEQSFVLIISVLFGVLFLKEKINKKIYLLMMLNMIGLILVITKGNFSNLQDIPLFGTLILLCQVLLVCIGQTMSMRVIKKTTSKNYMFMNSSIRLIVYIPIPFLIGETWKDFIVPLTVGLFLLMVYASVSIFVVDYLGGKSFKVIGYTKTQLFIPLIPLVSTISSMFIFQQWFNLYQYIGMIFVFIGLYYIIKLK